MIEELIQNKRAMIFTYLWDVPEDPYVFSGRSCGAYFSESHLPIFSTSIF
jgi:hypothetical protein